MKTTAIISAVIGILGFIFILSVVLALPVMWLWNSTLPELFGFKEISLWMAWKLSLLSSFLIKSSSISTKS